MNEKSLHDAAAEDVGVKMKSRCAKILIQLIRILSNTNSNTSIDLVEHLLTHKFEQNSVTSRDIEKRISRGVKGYFNNLTNNSPTKKEKAIQKELDVIFNAVVHDDHVTKNEASRYLSVVNTKNYANLDVSPRLQKKRKDNMYEIAKEVR